MEKFAERVGVLEPLVPAGFRGISGVKSLKHLSHGQKEKLIWGFGVGISRAKDELQVHCKRNPGRGQPRKWYLGCFGLLHRE